MNTRNLPPRDAVVLEQGVRITEARASAEDDLGVVAWGLGDRAAVVRLRRWIGRAEVAALDQLAEDDGHLELGEGGAEAAADAAAEGEPGVGAGRGLDEALGAERGRGGVNAWVAVDE